MIEIKNLDYAFADKQVLQAINLTIERGELIGVIGANGSGKTTLLKCIVGLYKTAQRVFLDKTPIEDYNFKARAKKIALMHQSEMVNFDFSCFDAVALGRFAYLDSFGSLAPDDRAVIVEKMAATNTTPFNARAITRLSGGERQRVLFAKTLVQQSPFILLDEPSATLDIKQEKEIFETALAYCRDQFGVVMSIHNIRLAAKYCPRIILLHKGRILADGAPDEVITAQHLKTAYGVAADVFYNARAGHVDFVIK